MVFGPKVSMNLINKPKKQQTFSAIIATLVFAQFPNSFYTFSMEKTDEFLRNSFVTLTCKLCDS